MTTNLLEAPVPSPVDYPHLRTIDNGTLADLAEGFGGVKETLRIEDGMNIRISDAGDEISVNGITLPATDEQFEILAGWAGFPKPYMKRLSPERKVRYLNEEFAEQHRAALVRIGQRDQIISVLGPDQIAFDPSMVIETAQTVLGEYAPVVDVKSDSTVFFLDVVTTPEKMPDLGDPRIGDITKAGLRFNLDLARNLAPRVNPWYYRLWCTNGCADLREDLKMDARGMSVEEVMADLEVKAQMAFAAVEHSVNAMYELRNQKVENPERTINRMAREFKVADSLRVHLVDAIPSMVEDIDDLSMFDLIQAATHLANAPEVRNRGQRESLENFGGSVISDHVERCTSCKSKLN